ncbi:MAG TPA: putative quinol monooxygenase [Xanthobacteraceae bacterium]|jgi:quinol monooxygenase YgiN
MRIVLPLVLAMVLTPIVSEQAARAQDPGDPTVYVVSYIDVAQATHASDANYLRQLAIASRKEPGVLRYDVFQRTAPSNQFVIIEIWKDQQSYDAHAASAHVKTFRQQIAPHLVAPIDERPYIALAVGAKESAAIPAGSFVSISHVDVIPPKKDDGVAALKALADPTRRDKGNLRYDIYQQKARPNHFTVVEVWTNLKAFDEHEVAAHTKQFRHVLGAATGALYDQRWYTALQL